MKKFSIFLLFSVFGIAGCDLQPKITALPDTVGDFITARYPTLLADPNAQPEIYNSAATDYGVYASPEVYGSSDIDDYVLYSSVDDYIVPPQPVEEPESDIDESVDEDVEEDTETPEEDDSFTSDDVLTVPDKPETESEKTEESEPTPAPEEDDEIAWDENATDNDILNIPVYGGDIYTEITVTKGDTLYLLSKKYNMTIEEIASLNNLSEPYPLIVGQKLRVRMPSEQVISEIPKLPEPPKEQKKPKKDQKSKVEEVRKTTTRVDVDEIAVVPGDTLYSLSRKYSVPVNDLAVMNNLSAPFALYAGQKLKVPDLSSAPVRNAKPATLSVKKSAEAKNNTKVASDKPKTDKIATKVSDKKEQPAKIATTKPEQKTKQAQQVKPTTKVAKQQKTSQAVTAKPATKATKMPAITARSSSKFSWPVRGKVLSYYGAKTNGLFNDGINVAAAAGTAVLAAENGVVAYAGNEVKGMGNLVIIQHSDGWMTVYAHMNSIGVKRGVRVGVGQKIGTVGQTGKVDKPQLHFEVRKGTKAYNPISYLKK